MPILSEVQENNMDVDLELVSDYIIIPDSLKNNAKNVRKPENVNNYYC